MRWDIVGIVLAFVLGIFVGAWVYAGNMAYQIPSDMDLTVKAVITEGNNSWYVLDKGPTYTGRMFLYKDLLFDRKFNVGDRISCRNQQLVVNDKIIGRC